MVKKVYLIRHAQSEANAAIDLDNPTFYYFLKGKEEGKKLSPSPPEVPGPIIKLA